jgi:hypothetical protein
MHLLDIYYRFQKQDDSKSKYRRDLFINSEYYEPLHYKNKHGKVWIYLSPPPEKIKSNQKRLCDLSLTRGNGDYISGLYFPEPDSPDLAYGDVKNTQDALLVLLSDLNRTIEIFVSKGKKNNVQSLFFLFNDGELYSEIDAYRNTFLKAA